MPLFLFATSLTYVYFYSFIFPGRSGMPFIAMLGFELLSWTSYYLFFFGILLNKSSLYYIVRIVKSTNSQYVLGTYPWPVCVIVTRLELEEKNARHFKQTAQDHCLWRTCQSTGGVVSVPPRSTLRS